MIKRDSRLQTRHESFGSENYSSTKIFWPVMVVLVRSQSAVHKRVARLSDSHFFFSGILTLKFPLNIHSLPAFPFGHKNNFLSSRSLSLTPTRLNYFLTRVGRSLIHSKRRLLFRFAQSRISVVFHSYFIVNDIVVSHFVRTTFFIYVNVIFF